MTPLPGQVVTVFRSRLRADADGYPADAAAVSSLARSMPGYVEHKVFTADDGERVTLVTFADEDSHRAWRDHPEHRAAQRRGVADYYETYSIQVGTTSYASSFVRPGGPGEVAAPAGREPGSTWREPGSARREPDA